MGSKQLEIRKNSDATFISRRHINLALLEEKRENKVNAEL